MPAKHMSPFHGDVFSEIYRLSTGNMNAQPHVYLLEKVKLTSQVAKPSSDQDTEIPQGELQVTPSNPGGTG